MAPFLSAHSFSTTRMPVEVCFSLVSFTKVARGTVCSRFDAQAGARSGIWRGIVVRNKKMNVFLSENFEMWISKLFLLFYRKNELNKLRYHRMVNIILLL